MNYSAGKSQQAIENNYSEHFKFQHGSIIGMDLKREQKIYSVNGEQQTGFLFKLIKPN